MFTHSRWPELPGQTDWDQAGHGPQPPCLYFYNLQAFPIIPEPQQRCQQALVRCSLLSSCLCQVQLLGPGVLGAAVSHPGSLEHRWPERSLQAMGQGGGASSGPFPGCPEAEQVRALSLTTSHGLGLRGQGVPRVGTRLRTVH